MELRPLRYFTAVVQWKGYREASRHLYIAQPSISEAVSDLESELGIKLFSREGRVARLTPAGQVFYEEAIKTLAQAERSIATAQRAAKGEIGRLGIGFIGFATYPFLSDLLPRSASASRTLQANVSLPFGAPAPRKCSTHDRPGLQRQRLFAPFAQRAQQHALGALYCRNR